MSLWSYIWNVIHFKTLSLHSIVDENIAVHRNSGSDRSADPRDQYIYGLGHIVRQPVHRWH